MATTEFSNTQGSVSRRPVGRFGTPLFETKQHVGTICAIAATAALLLPCVSVLGNGATHSHKYLQKIIPAGTNALTRKSFVDERRRWLKQYYRENYLQHGNTDPSWDSKVLELLESFAERIEGDTSKERLNAICEMATELTESGCDDPYVLYLHGNAVHCTDGAVAAEPIVEDSLTRLRNSGYPRFYAFNAARRLGRIRESVLKDRFRHPNYAPSVIEMYHAQMKLLAESLQEDDFKHGRQRYIVDDFDDMWKRIVSQTKPSLMAELDRVRDNAEPWLYNYLKGRCYSTRAWLTRGGSSTTVVSDEDRAAFISDMKTARDYYARAHELRPDFPEAAAEMTIISAILNDPVSPREWFDRSVAAQLDFLKAYDKMILALRPQWGGSHDALHSFGEECVATRRFDTIVPYKIRKIVWTIGKDLDDWRHAYRRDGMYETLKDYFENAQRVPADHSKCKRDTGHLIIAWAAQEYAASRQLYQELGDELHPEVFDSFYVDKNRVLREINAYTDDVATLLKQSDVFLAAGNYAGAVDSCMEAISLCGSNTSAKALICRKLATFGLHKPFGHAEKVADTLIRRGMREALFLAACDCARNHGVEALPISLRHKIASYCGSLTFDLVELLPEEESMGHDATVAALSRVDTFFRDRIMGRAGNSDDRNIELQMDLAKLRIRARCVRGNMHAKLKGVVPLKEQLKHMEFGGVMLDFMSEQMNSVKEARNGREINCLNMYQAFYSGRGDKELVEDRIMQELGAIKDNDALRNRCWELFWSKDMLMNIVLPVAELLRERGLHDDGSAYEEKLLAWAHDMGGKRIRGIGEDWSNACPLNILNRVAGYEEKAIDYGRRATRRGGKPMENFMTAEALLRTGECEEALDFFLKGRQIRNSSVIRVTRTAGGTHQNTKAYIKYLAGQLLAAHPNLSKEARTTLERASQ